MYYSHKNHISKLVSVLFCLSLIFPQKIHPLNLSTLSDLKSYLPTGKDTVVIGLQVVVPLIALLNQKYCWFEDAQLREHKRITWEQQQECNKLACALTACQVTLQKCKQKKVEIKNSYEQLRKTITQEELLKAYKNHIDGMPDCSEKYVAQNQYNSLVVAYGKELASVLASKQPDDKAEIPQSKM